MQSIEAQLLDTATPYYAIRRDGEVTLSREAGGEVVGMVPAVDPDRLGDPSFRACHGVKASYASGAMANGIASEELVIAMGKANYLSSFGAAGLAPDRIETAIRRLQSEIPGRPFAINLIHSPAEQAIERGAVDLFLKYGIRVVEASAYLGLTPHIVRYRVAGLTADGSIHNKVIAKVSRREVAIRFLEPAPQKILDELLKASLITADQAALAAKVPMADDVTVEADSGGHTDNRPLVNVLPSIIALRDDVQRARGYRTAVRVGAAGGIGSPEAALAAFMMGAAYVVTGSVNQSCVEAAASEHTKALLAKAEMADIMMAPAADMFEMGVNVQVLKRGTLFGPRARKLYEIYRTCESLEAIPAQERETLEKRIFLKSLDTVWKDTAAYFMSRDPDQVTRAEDNPKRKMALVFRWYLGLSSRWSNIGEKGRENDYQIWCGAAMGAFNDWVRGTYLEDPKNRRVADVAGHILLGAAFLYRVRHAQLLGVVLAAELCRYRPEQA